MNRKKYYLNKHTKVVLLKQGGLGMKMPWKYHDRKKPFKADSV